MAAIGSPPTAWLRVKVVGRARESDRIISLDLIPLDGEALPRFEAGAHVDVRVETDLVRQYSLCGDPAQPQTYRLGVLLEESSRGGSAGMHRLLRPGVEFEISPPRNHFPLVPDAESSLLIAGGIGITPILAMAHTLHRAGATFALHYCVRGEAHAAFAGELRESPFEHRVSIYHDDGPPEQAFAAQEVLRGPTHGRHLYVCGPGGFLNHVVKVAAFAGWQDDHIHLERFTAKPLSGSDFVVVAARSGCEVTVAAGQRISEALRDAGVDIEMSCEAGVCGTCFTTVLEGEPDHRDTFQTDSEKEANTGIAICCSGSRGKRLVLDI